MSSRFQYQARPAEAWAKREKGSSYEGYAKDEYQTYTPKKENWIRILPPTWDNPNHYGIEIYVHYSVGPSRASVLCLRRMKNEACPICEAHDRATQAGREDADQLKPTKRVLVWLIDRKAEQEGGPNYKKIPQLWAQPATKVDQEIAKQCRDRFTGELYQIDNPDSGNDVMFEKVGDQLATTYSGFQIAKRPSSVDDAYLEYIIANPLHNTLKWRSYEELQSLFEGQFSGEAAEAPPIAAPVTIAAPPVAYTPPAPQPPPPVAFVPEWLNTSCPACGQRQFTAPNGVTCQSGHLQERLPFTPPPPPVPPPQPVVVAPAPPPTTVTTPGTPMPPPPIVYNQPPPATSVAPQPMTAPAATPAGDRTATLRARFSAPGTK